MRKSWAITLKAEHEYYYAMNAVGLNTIKVEKQVTGDDEACDAVWAASEAVKDLRKQYAIGTGDRLHVIAVKIKEVV